MKMTMTIKTDADLNAKLINLSRDGGAWVATVKPFTNDVTFHRFASPSRVPDHFIDRTQNQIAWRGRIQGFTQAAIIRDQNRAVSL